MGWVRTNVFPSAVGARGSRPPEFFLYIFNTKSCILVHSLAPKMDTTSVFLNQDPYALGEMKTVGRGCRMRPEGPKIEAEGRERGGFLGRGKQAPPARGSGSDVNKTKFLRPRPKYKTKTTETKGTWRIFECTCSS